MNTEMTCEIALEQMDRFMDGALSEAETDLFAAHAGECEKCQGELELRERTRAGLRRAVRQPIDTTRLEQRIHAAVHVEASRRFRWQPHTIALAATLHFIRPAAVAATPARAAPQRATSRRTTGCTRLP